MATLSVSDTPRAAQTDTNLGHYVAARWPWLILAAFLILNLPLFLRMGLDSDVTLWDLCARNVLHGGVHYRDAVENNLPGMLWLHMAVRATLGWSSEALRAVDFIVVAAVTWLLVRSLPTESTSLVRAGLAFTLFAFYFTTSEWCHCQRDTWMLLPALATMQLRYHQVERLSARKTNGTHLAGWAILEGGAWACAFWIKPFVAIPSITCWLLGAWLARKHGARVSRLLVDGIAFITGGLVVGIGGIAWMVATGAWPYFLDIMLVWNPEYVAYDSTEGMGWMYIAGMGVRFLPWVLIHLAAVQIALHMILRGRNHAHESDRFVLLAGLYLGWLFQALVLQHLFDYIHIPAILLGLAVVFAQVATTSRIVVRFALVLFVLAALIVHYPAVYGRRLHVWARSLSEGGPALQDRLSLSSRVNWSDLVLVRDFLKQQNIQDGELTCFSMRAVPLYDELNIEPSTPYFFLHNALAVFPKQRDRIHRDLAASRQRFVVCDLLGLRDQSGALEEGDPETRPLPAMWQPPSRWADRVVFRAGRYVVFAIDGNDMPAWLDECFHL